MLTGLASIWLLTWVNNRGVQAGGKMQLVTTILKLVPLLFVAFIGVFFIRWKNFIPFNRSGGSVIQAIAATAAMTMFAFTGIECATIPADSIANAEKNVPRATMIGTLISTLVYIFGSMSVMGILPAGDLQRSVTPFSDAAAVIAGPHARYWVSAGAAVAAFGALNGWILMQGQLTYAVAKDGLVPPFFEQRNKKGIPTNGLVITSVLLSLVMMMNYTKGLVEQFKFMMLLATLTALLPYLFVSAAYVLIVMEKQPPSSVGGWLRVLVPAIFAFLFSLMAIIGAGQDIVFWGMVLLLVSTPLYIWNYWRRKSVKRGF
jgi:APA family basic amino acid/polyamine antiporter